MLPVLPANFDGVAKAIVGDKSDLGLVAFDQCVGRRRRAMQQMLYLAEIDAGLLDRLDYANGAILLGG